MSLIAKLRMRRQARGAPPERHRASVGDIERILSLPRRSPVTDQKAIDKLCDELTDRFRLSTGTMRLFPSQAVALDEFIRHGKLLGAIAPGMGKALLSLLLAEASGKRKCVLLVPPTLKAQTLQKVVPQMKQHWRFPTVGEPGSDAGVVVVTHSEISLQNKADILVKEQPELILIDEAHAFGRDSARGRRLFHYKKSRPCQVIPLSGSLIDPELEVASRLASISLEEGSPYPRSQEAVRLAVALDKGISSDVAPFRKLIAPGKTLRESVRQRVLETPGVVVAPRHDAVQASLLIRGRYPKIPKDVASALRRLELEWATPDGDEFSEITEYHRHAKELSQGFYYKWAWPDGVVDVEWLEARKEWNRAVRNRLRYAKPGADTEGLLRKAAAEGRWNTPAFQPWADVMDRRQPPTEAHWVSDFLVQDAVKWGKEPGIIWYKDTAFGVAVAEAGDFPLYDGNNGHPELVEKGNRTIVASWATCGTGLELQMFHRMYVPRPTSNPRSFDQLLARCHRPGQKKDVEVDVCLHTALLRQNFRDARDKAQLLAESAPGAERQKQLYADLLLEETKCADE